MVARVVGGFDGLKKGYRGFREMRRRNVKVAIARVQALAPERASGRERRAGDAIDLRVELGSPVVRSGTELLDCS